MSNVFPIEKSEKYSDTTTNDNVDLKELLATVLANQNNEKRSRTLTADKESENEDEIDLREIFVTLLESKYLLATITVLALLAGCFFAYVSDPVYSAEATVRIEKKRSLATTLGHLGGMLESELPIEDEIEILRSRVILRQVVENLSMNIIAKPRFYPVIGKAMTRHYHSNSDELAEIWFGANKYAWGGEIIELKNLEVPSEMVNKKLIVVAGQAGHYQLLQTDGQKLLEGQVNQPVAEINQIKLHISSLHAHSGTQFYLTKLNKQTAIQNLAERLTVISKGRGSNILTLKLISPDPSEAATTLNEIINIYLQQNVAYMSEEASQTLTFLENLIPKEKDRVDAATKKLHAYRLKQGSVDLSFETQGVLQSIVIIKERKQEFEREREELRSLFTASHPKIKSIDAQIRLLDSEIVKMNTEVNALPDTQQTVLRLTENMELAKKLYISLVNSVQKLRMTKAGTVSNIRVIDYAIPPISSFAPKKSLIIVIATSLGLILAIIFVFIRENIKKQGIKNPREIEDQLGLPIYASVPHSDKQIIHKKKQLKKGKIQIHNYGLIALNHPKDPAIEGLVSLATRLHFEKIKNSNNILLISGSSPGIGKSFISANLSAVLATQGKRTLVIDTDIRRGHLNRYFNLPRKNGLSEYLGSTLKLRSAIYKTQCQNLYVLPTGELPSNPVELLMGERFADMLSRLSQSFDYIIIDSAPILAVTDASIVARLAGMTLLVAKYGIHPISELEQCVKKFDHEDINLKGIIFNDIDVIDGYGDSYGKYIYQYDYV